LAANFQFWKELPALVRLGRNRDSSTRLGSFLASNCLRGKGSFGARDRPSKGKDIGIFNGCLWPTAGVMPKATRDPKLTLKFTDL
jgi:hypothetical protein